jgi:hypothetical protein
MCTPTESERRIGICEPAESSWASCYRSAPASRSSILLFRSSNIRDPWNNNWPARRTFSGFAANRYRTSIGSSRACGKIPRSSADDAARYLTQMPIRPIRPRRAVATIARDITNNSNARAYRRSSHTSTHSAATNSAIRDGAMRTALWTDPAAGTTSSNAFNDTSQ